MTSTVLAAPAVSTFTRADARPWLRLSIAAAAVAAIGSAIGLAFVDSIYGNETDAFVDQAIAQDLVNLVFVAPLMAYLAWRALHGSLAAYLGWLGFLTFTVYNYTIYTFSIHFGPLFLLWVAVYGASLFALIGGATALDTRSVADAFGHRPARWTAGFMVFTVVMFTLMWLSQIVPALLDGTVPEGAAELGLPTNPVQVLDLACFLPAVFVVGVALWRRRPLGYAATPAMLLFLALTGLPILTTVFVANARGHEAVWSLLVVIGSLTVAAFAFTWHFLARLRSVPDRSV